MIPSVVSLSPEYRSEESRKGISYLFSLNIMASKKFSFAVFKGGSYWAPKVVSRVCSNILKRIRMGFRWWLIIMLVRRMYVQQLDRI